MSAKSLSESRIAYGKRRLLRVAVWLLAPIACAGMAWGAPEDAPAPDVEAAPGETAKEESPLGTAEEQLAKQYQRFEEVLLRMAELTASEDPQRAALLRQAVTRSKKRLIAGQFDKLVELLQQDRLAVAVNQQKDLTGDLKGLLELLLSEDRAKRLESEQARVRAYLKELNQLIQQQQGVQAQTRRAGEATEQVADRQAKLEDRTGKLADQMKKDNDASRETEEETKDESEDMPQADEPKDAPAKEGQSGKPGGDDSKEKKPSADEQKPNESPSESESQEKPADAGGEPKPGEQAPMPGSESPMPPSAGDTSESQPQQPRDSAQQRLEAARNRMQQAQEKLKQAQRDDALEQQTKALEELEQAKADLEKILRQLREEELARMLTMLEARFRKMLDEQNKVYDATIRLASVPEPERGRSVEIESGRLGRQESMIALDADRALQLLRDDGTAIAMPEAVREIRDDMQQVAERLGQTRIDDLTRGIEEDIIAGLEEILAALEKAKKDLEQQQQEGQPPPPGEMQEPPLVDRLAEIKVIRALQMRVNRRTQSYAKLVEGEQTADAEILKALAELAERQERIFRTTRDLAQERNR